MNIRLLKSILFPYLICFGMYCTVYFDVFTGKIDEYLQINIKAMI